MNYINRSNPWIEAASMGRGIGESLANMLLQVPQVRAQMAERQQQMQWQGEDREFAKTLQPLQLQAARTQAELGPLQLEQARAGLAAVPLQQKAAETEVETKRFLFETAKEERHRKQEDMALTELAIPALLQGKPVSPEMQRVVSRFMQSNPDLFKTIMGAIQTGARGGLTQGQLVNFIGQQAAQFKTSDEINADVGNLQEILKGFQPTDQRNAIGGMFGTGAESTKGGLAPNEVQKYVGARAAIFDKNTHEFIRWQ